MGGMLLESSLGTGTWAEVGASRWPAGGEAGWNTSSSASSLPQRLEIYRG